MNDDDALLRANIPYLRGTRARDRSMEAHFPAVALSEARVQCLSVCKKIDRLIKILRNYMETLSLTFTTNLFKQCILSHICHKLSLPTFSYNDILCNAFFLTFAVMFSPLIMNFSLFLSYLSPIFHSFVIFCHLALVTVSFILCIMLCCDDDDDDDDDEKP